MPVASRPLETAGERSITPTEKKAGADVASRTDTASVNLPAFQIEDAIQIDAMLTVTAATGTTPTLAVALQSTMDGTNWYTVGTFPTQTAAGNVSQSFGGNLGVQGRWSVTITGTTPSLTYNIDHQARRVV